MSKANSPSKSANASGVTTKKYASSVLGGYPAKKSVEKIDSSTHGRSNGKAPGSVRN
jgi:hypothetical protein